MHSKSLGFQMCRWSLVGTFVGLLSMSACVGDAPKSTGEEPPADEILDEIGESGLRRLSAAEYDSTIYDLLGVRVEAALVLPQDIRRPFDNEYATQLASEALINSADSLAGSITTEVLADSALRDNMMPCEPTGADDEACYREFIASFGRRVLRRPLATEEVDRFAAFMTHAAEANDFWIAVDTALRVFLQHPEFLNRVEIGTPIKGEEGVFRLSDYELATRLSYLLWGSTPPPWLLDAAEEGSLKTAEGIRTNVTKLLEDPDAKERVARFHSMWLGYETLPHAPELATDLKGETGALINRVMFEDNAPWVQMLRSDETYLTPALAEHYELPAPSGSGGWVPYGSSGRQGLLSQGSFLSAMSKFGDTSPTQRGLLISRALFCTDVPLPDPELNVNIDEPPEGPDADACKIDRYNMWEVDGCKGCHIAIDPVGFGLENYDAAGRFRAFEPDRPDCPIDGKGTMPGVGDFTGPAELADMVATSPKINACVATHLYQFAMGRLDFKSQDKKLLERLVDVASIDGEIYLQTLIIELVAADAFRYRREEAAQ